MLSAIGSLYVIRTDRTGSTGLSRSTDAARLGALQPAPIAVHRSSAGPQPLPSLTER